MPASNMAIPVPAGSWRETAARVLWHAHPARPGPEYAFLRESQWWPRERIADVQLTALRQLVAAAERVPHYRERFAAARVAAGDLRTIDDLVRLPVLERDDLVRLGVAGIRTPGSWGVRARSSGSLGKPVEFLWPLSQMRWLDAGEARARSWFGSDIGKRRVEVRCRPVGPAQAFAAAILNTSALHAPSVADTAVLRRLAQSIERTPPTMIWGVSNALYAVALALIDHGTRVKVGSCVSGGNHLHPHYRRAMEEAFGCRVFERYATMETGVVAHECPEAGSLHVPAEGMIVEIVGRDGTPVAPGETGDVLVTALRNHATPLIRYRVGDRAVAPRSLQCACGRGLPVFGSVAGRSTDLLRTSTGGTVSPRQVVEAVRPGLDCSVVDIQVEQDAESRLVARVVQRASPQEASDRQRIAAVLDALVRPPEPPRVERVDRIGLTPGGKLRTIVSRMPGRD